MIFLEIKDLPWKGKETSAFPQILVNTVADAAIEVYIYTGESISVSVKDMDAANCIIAAVNYAVGSNTYGILKQDGEIVYAGTLPAVRPEPEVENINIQPQQIEPIRVDTPQPEPSVKYPMVVRRTSELNPSIDKINQIISRAAISDADLEKHLFCLKNASSETLIDQLNNCLEEYRRLSSAMTEKLRKINELSALSSSDDAVKSVIQQLRTISYAMPNNKITDVFVTKDYIVFQTSDIHALDARTNYKHNLGRILIIVSISSIMGSGAMGVSFQPLDYILKSSETRVSFLLPHVNGAGNYCYGNATDAFIEAIAKKDLISLVDVAIRFLENPNTNDGMGKPIAYWPKVEA